MSPVEATGWSADWLVGWLAALGAVTIVPGWQLSWTSDVVPRALLHGPGSPAEAAAELALRTPSGEALQAMTIARVHTESDVTFDRNFGRDRFAARASLARQSGDGTLEMSATDLVRPDLKGLLAHGPLDPPAPKGVTLHDRAAGMRDLLPDPLAPAFEASLAGVLGRVRANGLGFDARRFAAGVHANAGVWVEPAAELLAFFGLRWFPVRGSRRGPQQRGWTGSALAVRSFTWPAWERPMDCWAIDALLDVVYEHRAQEWRHRRQLSAWSVRALFATVPKQPRGALDSNRAFASLRLW